MMLRPLNGTLDEAAGLVPAAMTILSRLDIETAPRELSTRMVLGSTKLAEPHNVSTLLRESWAWVTSISGFDNVLHTEGEVGHGDLFLHAIVDAVNVLVVVAGEVQHGLAQRFAGNGSGVDARSANHFALLNDGDALAGFRALNRRALTGWSGADDDQIVLVHALSTSVVAGRQ